MAKRRKTRIAASIGGQGVVNSSGIASNFKYYGLPSNTSLGLQANAKVELETIIALLEQKLSDSTLFNMANPISDVTPTTEPS